MKQKRTVLLVALYGKYFVCCALVVGLHYNFRENVFIIVSLFGFLASQINYFCLLTTGVVRSVPGSQQPLVLACVDQSI